MDENIVVGLEDGALRRRRVESGPLGQLVYWIRELSPLWLLLGLIWTGLGFKFQWPSDWFEEQQQQIRAQSVRIDSIENRLGEAEVDRTEILDKLDALIELRCTELTPREMAAFRYCVARRQ